MNNYNCAGITYSYRLDSADALEFIQSFLPTGRRVLLYWGNGGVGPGTEWGSLSDYYKAKAFFELLGYAVDYTAEWPNGMDLSLYKAIFLLGPGHASSDNMGVDGFTLSQVNQLDQYIQGGGRLVVMIDHSGFTGQAVENDLLMKLIGGNIQFKSQSIGFSLASQIQANPLTSGVAMLDFDQATGLTVSGTAMPGWLGKLAASHPTDPNEIILAADTLGSGDVIAIGDLNWMDDWQWQGDFDWSCDNEKLLFRIVSY